MFNRVRFQKGSSSRILLLLIGAGAVFFLIFPGLGLLNGPVTAPVSTASAQSGYTYTILKEECTLYVDPNGGADIEYLISIQNQGAFLKGLDIRMPNIRYDLDSAQATISGNLLSSSQITESKKYDKAVHVDFGANPIPSNGLGTLWLKVWDPVMALEDKEYSDYSTIAITPAWFQEDENTVVRELVVTIKLPLDTPPGDVVAVEDVFKSKESDGQTLNVQWTFENIHWSKSSVRRDIGIRVPSDNVEAHSEFREITLYEYLELVTPLNIAILIGAVILLIIAIILLNRAIGKRAPYEPPTFTKDVSLVDQTLGPAKFAYLDGRKPQRIMAILLLLAIRDGVVTVSSKDPLKIRQGKGKSRDPNSPFKQLNNGMLDPVAVRSYFEDIKEDLDTKAGDYDLEATKKHYARRMEHSFTRLGAAKGALEEIRTIDQEIGWMILDRSIKKRWGNYLQDNEEVTIPEWLFLLLYDDKDYTTMRFKPAGGNLDFFSYLKDRAGTIFELSGVTVDGEDTDELLIEQIYGFEKLIEADPEVKSYLSTIRKYKPSGSSKTKPNLKKLGESNRGAYIKYGGGV